MRRSPEVFVLLDAEEARLPQETVVELVVAASDPVWDAMARAAPGEVPGFRQRTGFLRLARRAASAKARGRRVCSI